MNNREQMSAFQDDLGRLLARYRAEFDLTYAEIIGVLMLEIHDLNVEAAEVSGEEDPEG